MHRLQSCFVFILCLQLCVQTGPSQGGDNVDKEWEEFKQTFGKKYKSELEEAKRKDIFIMNIRTIKEHNMKYKLGQTTYNMGINHLADTLPDETVTPIGKDKGYPQFHKTITLASFHRTFDPPDSWDWRQKDAIGPVKKQGGCGSCWAFTATGALESHYRIQTGKRVSLSEQYLVDCSSSKGNLGCDGGATTYAFDYIKENGIPTDQSYPYVEEDKPCQSHPIVEGLSLTGYLRTEPANEEHLKNAVASKGPVAVTIDGNHSSFNFYSTGIHYQPECRSDSPTHAALVVGYGSEEGNDYWIVKNSWGPGWGDGGFIKMARNRDNNCGISSNTAYPEIKILTGGNGQNVHHSSVLLLMATALALFVLSRGVH